MHRILRADADWQEELADALRRAARPIPLDQRFVARGANGEPVRSGFTRSALPPARPAATLLAIYPGTDGRLTIPLTVRHADMRSHAGEVSLPGGAVDAGDAGPEAAALREASEEIGLDPALVRIAGSLDPVWIPVSNFELRAFVGTVAARPTLVPHDAEVAAIVELPLEGLFDEGLVSTEQFDVRGLTIRTAAYRYAGVRVWGATALTLGMLAHVLRDAAGDGISASSVESS